MRATALSVPLTIVAAVLSACASGSQSPFVGAPNIWAATSIARLPDAPNRNALKTPDGFIPPDLYVADPSLTAVFILRNKTYRDVGVITNGISYPIDVFLDPRGNLYVANSLGNVEEYAPGHTQKPKFTYSAGMTEPLAITTDAHGNLFEADYYNVVNEYFQRFNSPVATCNPGGILVGVAVDSNGDVFVIVFPTPSGPPQLAEYPGGLGNCAGKTILGVPLNASVQGIALDANNNLLVADDNQVLVIDPPYSSVSGTIGSGFGLASNVRLNKRNTRAFVSDRLNNTVTVVSYPAGKNVIELGAQNGLSQPDAAVDSPNAVY